MKTARKPTKVELADLALFIFFEDSDENGLFAWWVPLLSQMAFILKRIRAIWAVKKAGVTVFDGCWMKKYGYVDRAMTVQWRLEPMEDEGQDIFVWFNGQLQLVPSETKFWQRAFKYSQTLEPRGNSAHRAYSVKHG